MGMRLPSTIHVRIFESAWTRISARSLRRVVRLSAHASSRRLSRIYRFFRGDVRAHHHQGHGLLVTDRVIHTGACEPQQLFPSDPKTMFWHLSAISQARLSLREAPVRTIATKSKRDSAAPLAKTCKAIGTIHTSNAPLPACPSGQKVKGKKKNGMPFLAVQFDTY